MTAIVESTYVGDVVKSELPLFASRKRVTIGHSQTLVVGQLIENNAGEYQALSAAINEVQTLTLAPGTDGGKFRVRYKEAVSAELAWNVSAADMQTALRALHTDLAACVVGLVGEVYTVTITPVGVQNIPLLEVVNDYTLDGGVAEGGIVVARTTVGYVPGGKVAGICLAAATTGAHPATVDVAMLERDAVVNKSKITYGANIDSDAKKLVVDALLEAMSIRVRTTPTYS